MNSTEVDTRLISSYQIHEDTYEVGLGQQRAWNFSVELMQNERRYHHPVFYPGMLMDIHSRLLQYYPGWAGQYRADDETRVASDNARLANAEKLGDEVYKFELWLSDNMEDLKKRPEDLEGAVGLATAAHYLLVSKLHPFNDGNGRLARILTNMILMSNSKEFVEFGQPITPVPILRDRVDTERVKRALENGSEPQLSPYLDALKQVDNSNLNLRKRTLNPLEAYIVQKWQQELIRIYVSLSNKYGEHWRKKLDSNAVELAEKLIDRSISLGNLKHHIEQRNHRKELLHPDFVPDYTPHELI